MTQTPTLATHPSVETLIELMAGTKVVANASVVEFDSDDCYVVISIQEPSPTLRIRVYFPTDDEELVRGWVDQQDAPASGILQHAEIDDLWSPRLVFERPARLRDWATDAMADDILRYSEAWSKGTPVSPRKDPAARFVIEDDPIELVPASAWLLFGTEPSFPTTGALEQNRIASQVGIYDWDWTTASQTSPGDLALFYFQAPRKAVHFVARAATYPYFSRDITVGADKPVTQAQWWGRFTRLIPIEPILLNDLRTAADADLLLRGRSGKFLPPHIIDALDFRALDPADQVELDQVLVTPAGLADLPSPADIDSDTWRLMSPGAFPLEAHVSSHIVEPLLNIALANTGVSFQREFRIERRLADYVLLEHERPKHVIEVKKAIRRTTGADWTGSPDYAQTRWYAERLGTAATLIDSTRILLTDEHGSLLHDIDRQTSTETDLKTIRQHLLGGAEGRSGRPRRG